MRELFERLFGAHKIHYWEPFEAVVKGAAIFGAGFHVDQIVHYEYAICVYNENEQRSEYERLIPRGISYPTPSLTRYYTMADDQQLFCLPICAIRNDDRSSLRWKRRIDDREYWQPNDLEAREYITVMNEEDGLYFCQSQDNQRSILLKIDFCINTEKVLVLNIIDENNHNMVDVGNGYFIETPKHSVEIHLDILAEQRDYFASNNINPGDLLRPNILIESPH